MYGGIEWFVDGHDCVPAKLRDRAAVLGLLDRIVVAMDLHVISTVGAFLLALGMLTTLCYLAVALFAGKRVANPWRSRSFEWRHDTLGDPYDYEEAA